MTSSTRETAYHEALGSLNDTALDSGAWARFMTRFAGAVGARGAQYLVWSDAGWLQCHEHFNNDFVSRSEFYNDFLIPVGARYLSVLHTFNASGNHGTLGFLRPTDQAPFDRAELEYFERVEAHVKRASRIWWKMQQLSVRADMGERSLDALAHAMMIVDSRGVVRFQNAAAVRWLAGKPGVAHVGGRLRGSGLTLSLNGLRFIGLLGRDSKEFDNAMKPTGVRPPSAKASPAWALSRRPPVCPAHACSDMTPTVSSASCIRRPSGTVSRWFRNRRSPFRSAPSAASSCKASRRQEPWWGEACGRSWVTLSVVKCGIAVKPISTATGRSRHLHGSLRRCWFLHPSRRARSGSRA